MRPYERRRDGESVPSSQANAFIWIAFNRARWYSAGGASTRIYVSAVEGGLIAPFVRRAG